MSDPSHPEHQPEHKVFDISHPEGRMNWIVFDFWPIMLFVVLFLVMVALPLTLSGFLHNPFSSADVVWAGYGLAIFLAFVLALAIFIVAPGFIMPYTLLLAIYALILAEGTRAWTVGGTPWGNSAAILFLTYVLFAWLVLFNANRNARKSGL